MKANSWGIARCGGAGRSGADRVSLGGQRNGRRLHSSLIISLKRK